MSKTLNSLEDILPKPYSCFICSKNSSEKGLPLLVSETTHSRICLGEKLQEILGNKLVILLNRKDSVCWKCATAINKFDKFEHELDLIKDHVLSNLLKKHNISIDDVTTILEEESPDGEEEVTQYQETKERESVKPANRVLEEEPNTLQSAAKAKSEKPKVRFNPQVKVKSTNLVDEATQEESLPSPSPVDAAKEFQCPTCMHCFQSSSILETHVKLHNLAKSRFYKCKICEFSSTNLETYCRHVCNFNTGKYVSCADCKRNFLSSIDTEDSNDPVCQQCSIVRAKAEHVANRRMKENITNEMDLDNTPMSPASNPCNVPKSQTAPSTTSASTNMSSNDTTTFIPSDSQQMSRPLIKKITTEGSIKYEEAPHDVSVTIDNSSNATSNVQGNVSSGEIVVQDDEPAPQISIKTEVPDEDDDSSVREIVLPDHIIEHINNKARVNSPYMLKCGNCSDVLDVRQLPSHKCFLELESVEFSEVDNALEIDMRLPKDHDEESFGYIDQDGYYHDGPVLGVVEEESDETYQPRLLCKTCFQQFPSIVQLREHWQESGHAWEVGTLNVDVKTIKDKVKDNEQTFKVVKQMFSMKANLPVQNNTLELEFTDDHMFNIKNMFVKVRSKTECDTCGKPFSNEEVLKDHQVYDCLTCTFCDIRFLTNSLLKKHYQCTGHWKNIIRDQDPSTKPPPPPSTPVCPLCHKEFYSRYSLGVHLKTHYRGTERGACHYCFKEFDQKSDIYQHVVDVHNAQLFKCAHCDATFLSEWKKDKHQVIKHKGESVECKLCRVKMRSLKMLLRHNEQYHREKTCRICGKHIGSWQSLRRHERRHFYEKGLQCTLCRKSFRNKTALKVHYGNHHKSDFKYHCDSCEAGFMTLENLEEHKIIHIKSKKVCLKCGKKFNSRTAFWMHTKMHNGPYSCTVCSRVFRDTSLLAIHIREKHLHSRPYQCPHCPRSFSVPRTLRRHLSKHTQSYPYRCDMCRRQFVSKLAYKKHMDNLGAICTGALSAACKKQTAPLPLDPTDEDIFQAADTLISDDSVMLNGNYQRNEDSSELITEVVVETTELFEEILS